VHSLETFVLRDLGRVRVVERRNSYNRETMIVERNEGGRYVVKIKQEGADQAMVDSILAYRDQLEAKGITCVKIIYLYVESGQLVEVEPVVSGILDELFASAESGNDVARLLFQFRRFLSSLLQGGNDLPVGIDLAPRNFAIDNGQVLYLDLFPVKLRLSDGAFTLEHPEPTDPLVRKSGYLRHYTAQGALTVLLTHLGSQRPDLWNAFKAEFDQTAAADLTRVFDAAGDSIKTALSRIPPESHFLFLRYMACQLASRRRELRYVREVFDLTHFQNDEIPMTNLNAAIRILEEGLSK
jgi:hypothetical protein